MSLICQFGEQEEGIPSYKQTSGFFIRRSLKMLITGFLCVAILFAMNIFVATKTDAAVKLSQKYMVVQRGQTGKLILNGAKANKVTWSVSNPFVGSVNNGVFTSSWMGVTKVNAKYKNKTYTCKVVVPNPARVLYLNKYKKTITDKSSFKLKVSALGQVKYHSGNSHIARVKADGTVVGVNPGTTYVTAKTAGAAASCKVKVKSAGEKKVVYAKWLYDQEKVAIRKVTAKGNFRFGPLLAKAGKTLSLSINNIKEKDVNKVVWSSANKQVADVLPKGKIGADVKALAFGKSKISAVIFYKSGKSEVLSNTIHVSNPQINTKHVICFTKTAGLHRQQYVYFTGLSNNSIVKYKVTHKKNLKVTISNNKCKLFGKKTGTGTVKATVDGKKYKVKYHVLQPRFGSIIGVLARGNTTKINITGISGLKPTFTSRNPGIASVAADGTITGLSAGVTYIDVELCNMTFTYRVEVAAKGMKTIIKRAKYIVNNWTYSQGSRMSDGYYDCSALVWKGYKAYKGYNAKLGSKKYALPAGYLFDYLREKHQIAYFGFTKLDDLCPGDLFFYGDYDSAVRYSTPGRTLNIYHVAMYAGNGRVVEKGTPKYDYNSLDHIVGVGRVVKY